MEDFFKFSLVLVALCIAIKLGYFEKPSNAQVGTVIENKLSAKDKMTDKQRKEAEGAYQVAAADCKSNDSLDESGGGLLQKSYRFNFKTGSCEESKTLWTENFGDDIWKNPNYLSRNVVIKTYTLPTNPYY